MKILYHKNFIRFLSPLYFIAISLVPLISYAQTGSTSTTTQNVSVCNNDIETLADFINLGTCIAAKSVVPLLFTIAIVIFIWGVIQYVINPEQTEKREQGRTFMIWGIIGLFVMVSIWGLVQILQNTIGLQNPVTVPVLPIN